MPDYRMQVAIGADSTFPRDRIVTTWHFNVDTIWNLGSLDAEALCQDMINHWQAAWLSATLREIRATMYQVGPPPQYPIAQVIEHEGLCPPASGNREIALCLSYYNQRSNPRRRGRIYMPLALQASAFTSGRPSTVLQQKTLDFANGVAGLGGLDVDWVVYSPTNGESYPVAGAWVDDAYDIVRSRGLAPTTRLEATVGP